MAYSFNNIRKGDKVQFSNKYINNTNSFWKVIAKLDNTILMVELISDNNQERRMIDVSDVTKVIPANS